MISITFKKACKKLRKKRDLKKSLVTTTGVVVELLRKVVKGRNISRIQVIDTFGQDQENPLKHAKEGFVGNSTER